MGSEGVGGSIAEFGENIVKSVDDLKLKYVAEIPASRRMKKAVDSFIMSLSDDVFETLCSSKCKGLQKVLDEMASQGTKFIGGKFQLEYAAKLVKEGFEVELEAVEFAVVNGVDKMRRIDIVCRGKRFCVMDIELKNWSKIYSSSFMKQFVEFDLLTMTKNNPKIWVFKKTKGIPDVETLQKKILEELKKDDVKKKIKFKLNEKPEIKEQLKDFFEVEKEVSDKDLYKILSDKKQFEKIFKLEDLTK